MGLKNWFFRNFMPSYYNEIDGEYKSIRRYYRKGFDYYLNKYKLEDNADDFDLKLSVKDFSSIIKQYDKVIKDYERMKTTYWQGFDFYLKQNKLVDNNTYAFVERISNNKEQIKSIHLILESYDNLKVTENKGIQLYLVKNNLKSVSFEEKKKICQNKKTVTAYSKQYDEYKKLKKEYLDGFTLYCNIKNIKEVFSIDFINKILNDKFTIREIDGKLKRYELFKNKYKYAICLFLGVETLNSIDYDTILMILENEAEIAEIKDAHDAYICLKDIYPKSVRNFIKGNTINKDIVKSIGGNPDLFKISEAFHEKARKVPEGALKLFGLLKKDINLVSDTTKEKKKDFIEYYESDTSRNLNRLECTMSNSAKPAISALFKSSLFSQFIEKENVSVSELCKAIKVLYNHNCTLEYAQNFICDNYERILLYYKRYGLNQGIEVSTLEHIVLDNKLIRYMSSVEEEKRLRQQVLEIMEKYPKGVADYRKRKIIKDDLEYFTLEDLETFVAIEDGIKSRNQEILDKEELKRKREKELRQARQSAKRISERYPRAMALFVERGFLLEYNGSLSLYACNDIIAKEQELEAKEQEIIQKEEELRQARQSAKQISERYPRAIAFFETNGLLKGYKRGLSLYACNDIIAKEQELEAKEQEIIQKEEELRQARQSAKRISECYPRAMALFVELGSLIEYNSSLSLEACNDIIAKERELEFKEHEIIQKEKELRQARQTAKQISERYPRAMALFEMNGLLRGYKRGLSLEACNDIIANVRELEAKEQEIIQKEEELRSARQSAKQISERYPRAMALFVELGSLIEYNSSLSLEACNDIIAKERDLEFKEHEIIQKEEEDKRLAERTRVARYKAEEIKRHYTKGYNYYVNIGNLSSLSLEELERIVANESNIISKHKEIEKREEEERKRREDEERVKKANALANQYPFAFKALFSSYINTSNSAEVLSKEYELRSLNSLLSSVSKWDYQIRGIPYYFFYYYYPVRYTNVSDTSRYARSMIFRFKDGSSHSEVVNILQNKLEQTFSSSDLRGITFVCIPASTRSVNKLRYYSFAKDLCERTGMRNGFEHIEITKEKEPSHLGGTSQAEYYIDNSFFNKAKVILFDDVVTKGSSMEDFKAKMRNAGAVVICAISIGRTYSDYYGDNRQPHPWAGCL